MAGSHWRTLPVTGRSYWLGYGLLRAVTVGVMRVAAGGVYATGQGRVPASGPVLIMANHASALDPFLISFALGSRPLCGPAKAELFRNPILGLICRTLGM